MTKITIFKILQDQKANDKEKLTKYLFENELWIAQNVFKLPQKRFKK